MGQQTEEPRRWVRAGSGPRVTRHQRV